MLRFEFDIEFLDKCAASVFWICVCHLFFGFVCGTYFLDLFVASIFWICVWHLYFGFVCGIYFLDLYVASIFLDLCVASIF